jgi:4-hydroxy-tetrahydrodipicolinate reductase
MRLWLHGHSGKMGLAIKELLAREDDIDLVGLSGSSCCFDGIEKAEVVIDFSSAAGTMKLLAALEHISTRVLICSTGHSDQDINSWGAWCKNHEDACLVFAPNTSLAIQVMKKMLVAPTEILGETYDVSLLETHHKHKKDAPSGTAIYLKDQILALNPKQNIDTNSIRSGGVIGEHTVRFVGEFDEIVVTHRAFDRRLFAQGAIVLARNLSGYPHSGMIPLADLT